MKVKIPGNIIPQQKEKIVLKENQLKVIRDKYLRDALSVESWLEKVAHNIALAEMLYHPDAEKWGVFDGVHHVTIDARSNGVKHGRTVYFHDGLHECSERDSNFQRLIVNLENTCRAIPEAGKMTDIWQNRFYGLMSSFNFLPNSPTLMNAGRELQQLSACYVLPVPDSIEGIAKAVTAQSLIQKSGGGTGFSFEKIRPKGDIVKKTRGVASGAISFMQIFDKMTDVVKQGGTRRGANMGILPYWHPEIKDFINMKSSGTCMENFNISVALDEKFMKAVYMDAEYDLINPRTREVTGKNRAREIFDMLVECAWKSGDPGVIFLDRINQSGSNPTPAMGQIEATNPCFAGTERLATDRGLVTFEELYLDKTEIMVATDNRVPAIRGMEQVVAGGIAISVSAQTGTTMRKALPVFKTRKNWPVFRLETEHGFEVTATADHKFFTPEGPAQLKDLKQGDEILIQSGTGVWSKNYSLPPFLPENKLKARMKRAQANLPRKWSRELGELLGWAMGDGWVSEEKPKGRNVPNYTIGLMYGDEEKKLLAPRFRSLIKEWTGLDGTGIERNGTLTQYYKSALFYFLRSLGLHEKNGLNKEVPEALWKAPREAVLGFLSALFTADGTVNVSKNVHYGSIRLANSSKKLLQEVQSLLINEGIVSHLYLRRKAGNKLMPDSKRQPKLYAYHDQFELVITRTNRARFIRTIGFLTPSKQKKAEAFERTLSRGPYQEPFTTRVKAVSSAGRADVYCTTEPETHSLICAGIIGGNCGEQPLLPWEPCNLGSLNLSNFVMGKSGKGTVDYNYLDDAIKAAIRFLDNVIDVNNYPFPEIEKMAKGNRRIGLGVMGWAETLMKLGAPYDSPEGLEQAEQIMKFINTRSLEHSETLAGERGVFPNWKDSIYDPSGPHFSGQKSTPRNSARTTIAPTGTIAIAAGLQGSGIEPFFGIAYTRFNAKALEAIKSGREPDAGDTFSEVNSLFREVAAENGFFGLEEEVLWKKIRDNNKAVRGIPEIPKTIQELFPTAHDISLESHIQMQSAFQKHTDNGVSKTINMPATATMDDVRKAYKMAYDLGCKGITVYRDGCKTQQVLNLNSPSAVPMKKMKKEKSYESFGVSSEYFQLKTGYGPLHIHINYDEHGPYQVFTNIPPLGTEISGLTSLIGILLSKYLEEGGDPVKVMKHLNSVKGDRPMGFGENRINSIAHGVAVALRSHLKRTGWMTNGNAEGGGQKLELWEMSRSLYCPKCYSSNVSYESGCSGPTCHDCGHSECS
ncbi:MAG: LAGLIDADG family homing endonuclease [bacterium]